MEEKKELRCANEHGPSPQDEYNHYVLSICTNITKLKIRAQKG